MSAPAAGPGAQRVVLIGLSGSGKSTVGRALARRMAAPFVDTDDLIVQLAGKPIPRVFEDDGEPAFRAIERRAVREALDGPARVIATGGGAPVDAENRRALWEGGLVVWLDAPVRVLVRRVGHGAGRPLLEGDAYARLERLRAEREAIYALAHVRIDTAALSTTRAVSAIQDALGALGARAERVK